VQSPPGGDPEHEEDDEDSEDVKEERVEFEE
jgi:hypothetical protein